MDDDSEPDARDQVDAPNRVDRRRARAMVIAIVTAAAILGGVLAVQAGEGDGEGHDTATPARSTTSTRPPRSTTSATATTSTSTSLAGSTTVAADGTTMPTATTAPPDAGPCDVAAAIRRLPLRQRLGQLLMRGVAPSSSAAALDVAAQGLGGVFVTHGSDATAIYTSGRLRGLTTPEGIPVAVAVDDEGGRVQSIAPLAGNLSSARVLAATKTTDQVRELARGRADKLRSYGVTVNFAPVLDLGADPPNPAIGDRSFSDDPAVVARYGQAFAEGMAAGGVTPVFKHFPGHGRAVGDSHKGTSTTPPLAQLRTSDLVPFELLAGSGASWVMVGHLEVPGLTGNDPASLSGAAIDGLLRGDLGYQGLVVSDELGGMRAVSARYSLAQAVVRFLNAGGDLALWQTDPGPATVLDDLEAAVAAGSLTEATVDRSVARVLAAKGYDPCTTP